MSFWTEKDVLEYIVWIAGETQALFISAMKIISVSFVFAGVNIAF